jgi:hypothetical protein
VDNAIKMKLYARAGLAPLLALAMLFSIGTMASGQSTQPMQPAPPTATPPSTPNPPTATPPNPPVAQPVGPTPRWNPPDDITRREIADMNHFLDSHPEIAEQLRRDPSLIDNRQWVAAHPELQEYLQSHQRIADVFRQHPDAFMRDEARYDQQTNINQRDLEDMGRFLNSHPEIAEQLRKDPSLIDNQRWVANHPELQEYLRSHAQVADAFRAHPDAFMRDEERYDRDHDRYAASNVGDRNRGELTSFGQFLGGHSNVASELANDPSLANNKEYLANHPELDEYLKAHPAMSQQLADNPQAVMSSNVVQQGGFGAKPVGPTPRPKSAVPNQ